jgi:DNA replication and repair protein RecF
VNVVLFSPEDLELIAGSPATRRRYLDIMLCQVDRHYYRSLQQYNRVVVQRNALLRQLGGRLHAGAGVRREGRAPTSATAQLEYWNQQLAAQGAHVLAARFRAMEELRTAAATEHALLLGQDAEAVTQSPQQALHLCYRPTLEGDVDLGGPVAEIQRAYAEHLARIQGRELQQGVTLVGPHRDDFSVSLGGVDMHTFGSRGQHRTAALAVKLAELRLMQHRTGEQPILLLDEVASELDSPRRAYLLRSIAQHEQVLLTTSDLELLDPAFVRQHPCFEVCAGTIVPAVRPR